MWLIILEKISYKIVLIQNVWIPHIVNEMSYETVEIPSNYSDIGVVIPEKRKLLPVLGVAPECCILPQALYLREIYFV